MITRAPHALLGMSASVPRPPLRRSDKILAAILALGLGLLFLWPFTVFVVRPGEVGVLYRLFTDGTVTTFVYDEGLGFKWPWNRIYRYELRTQAEKADVHALASDGLTVDVGITVLFRPIADEAGVLHKTIGPEYVERLVRPSTIESVRNIIGQTSPHNIYQMDVNLLQERILDRLNVSPGSDVIEYVEVVIRDLSLPQQLNDAITRKLTEEQIAEAYEYILQQARQEAERLRIEAIGIQTFYSIVADALSPQLLTWRGIEATVQIARSSNAKVVIVGGGKDQLPLILGSDIATQPDVPPPPAVEPGEHRLPDFEDLPSIFPEIGAFDGGALRSAAPASGATLRERIGGGPPSTEQESSAEVRTETQPDDNATDSTGRTTN